MADPLEIQLVLPLTGVPDPDFSHFFPAGNEQLLLRLQRLAQGLESGMFYLWGPPAAGKSHLLQAVCLEAQQAGLDARYLAGRELLRLQPDALLEMVDGQLLCLDDLDCLLELPGWDECLFHLYNRQKDLGAGLVASAQVPPQQLPASLPDLLSRLTAMERYQVQALADVDKSLVLRQAARARGFDLGEEVISFILQHARRDMVSLQKVLQRLDQRSLTEKRLITLPFVKKVMGW